MVSEKRKSGVHDFYTIFTKIFDSTFLATRKRVAQRKAPFKNGVSLWVPTLSRNSIIGKRKRTHIAGSLSMHIIIHDIMKFQEVRFECW